MSDDNTKSILLVKKSDSKKGSLWNTLTHRRIIKQHGGMDIPENDLHAIHKYESPIPTPQTTSEEANAVLSDLEKEIQQLKIRDNQPRFSQNPDPKNTEDPFDYED